MSRDIKLRDSMDGKSASILGAPDASTATAEAIRMFGGNASTAVAYCGLDAWLAGDDDQVEFWNKVLNRLTT